MKSGTQKSLCYLLFTVVAAMACGKAARTNSEPPRLVLLYAPCTVSTSFLAPYEETITFTPNLARFASTALIFANHRTQAGSSGIAYASLFSGLQSDRHGVVQHPAALNDDLYLIAEAFSERGYETYFWNGHGMASMGLNYGQGVRAEEAFDEGLRADHAGFVALLEGLRADPKRRAFVMTNFTFTHPPYRAETVDDFLRSYPDQAPPIDQEERRQLTKLYTENHLAFAFNFEATARRFGIGPAAISRLAAAVELAYKANIWRLDAAFGSIIDSVDASGLRSDSLVVFTADHGELLFRREELFKWTHSSSLAPEVIDVPFLARAQALTPGLYTGVTRSIDVFPTMLGLSGLPLLEDQDIDGQNLAQPALGLAPPPDLIAYSHTSVIPESVYLQMREPLAEQTWGHRMRLYPRPDIRFSEVALRRRNLVFKLRNDGIRFAVEAFDRSQDPDEILNIFDLNDPRHHEMAEDLRRYKRQLVASVPEGGLRDSVPPGETEELLRALGYIE